MNVPPHSYYDSPYRDGYFIISKSDVKSEKLNLKFRWWDQPTYEFIFDSDKSTYFKLDSKSAKE